ncbi:MAG: hypothetical protein JWQ76_1031 [Ramlibacter sp.]|nr:hypothetical protein [Ramlibacter sp.]
MNHAAPARSAPVPIDSAALAAPCHACAFFGDAEEEYAALLPFAKACAHCGGRCLQFLDPALGQERAGRMAAAGIGVASSAGAGRAELRPWEQAYLRGGRFDVGEMLALIEAEMAAGRSFGSTRLWANMEWALSQLPGCDGLVEYESRLNSILKENPGIVVCVYDHGKFGAGMVMDILRTHPVVLVGNEFRHNPLYVPTELFLDDLRQRRGGTLQ